MRRFWLPLTGLIAAGCVESFAYRPPMHTPGAPHFNLRAAVVQFEDKTEPYTDYGLSSASPGWMINLVKGGGKSAGIPELPPEIVTQYFTDDLEAARLFETVRIFGPRADMPNIDVAIQGAILKLSLIGHGRPSEFSVHFRAISLAERRILWEETLTHQSIRPSTDCETRACAYKHLDSFLQGLLEGLFTKARARLAERLPPR